MHNCTYLKIEYLDKYYEEIKEIKEFGFEDFISGMGGFIGIFLGYSMMQIPQLIGTAVRKIRVVVAGLQKYWKAYLDRNREFSQEDGPLRLEINRINTTITDFRAEIIESLRKGIEGNATKIIELERNFERIQHKVNDK